MADKRAIGESVPYFDRRADRNRSIPQIKIADTALPNTHPRPYENKVNIMGHDASGSMAGYRQKY